MNDFITIEEAIEKLQKMKQNGSKYIHPDHIVPIEKLPIITEKDIDEIFCDILKCKDIKGIVISGSGFTPAFGGPEFSVEIISEKNLTTSDGSDLDEILELQKLINNVYRTVYPNSSHVITLEQLKNIFSEKLQVLIIAPDSFELEFCSDT